jgi:hypothetical protein
VKEPPFDGFFGTKFDILKPRWLPTPVAIVADLEICDGLRLQ